MRKSPYVREYQEREKQARRARVPKMPVVEYRRPLRTLNEMQKENVDESGSRTPG